MKHLFTRLVIGLLYIVSVHVVMADPPADILNQAKNSYIFTFDAAVTTEQAPTLAASLTEEYGGTLRHVFTTVLHGFSATMSYDNALLLVSENATVAGFVNNGIGHVPGAEGSAGAKGGKGNKGKPQPSSSGQHESWGIGVVGSQDVNATTHHAWIIDTGISDYYAGNELVIDTGVNFVTKGQDTTDDTNGHGTAVAGIIAAMDNQTGMLGVAAGATVHPVRVLHKSLWGTVDDIIKGVDYVAQHIGDYPGAKQVVNMSITVEIAGQEEQAALLDEAIENAIDHTHVKFAVCAGNQGTDVSLYTPAYLGNDPKYGKYIFTIASVDQDLAIASDSNLGDAIDYVDPGVYIETLKPGGGTWYWSGCSMATPHVAGILLLQNEPSNGGVYGYPLATLTGQ